MIFKIFNVMLLIFWLILCIYCEVNWKVMLLLPISILLIKPFCFLFSGPTPKLFRLRSNIIIENQMEMIKLLKEKK